MKRVFVLAAAVLLVGGVLQAQISGSAHDFNLDTWNPNGEICQVCHTPHGAATTPRPLWNHDSTAETGYTYYGDTLLGTATATSLAGTSSLVCMSCHDGTVGLGAFGGAVDATYITGAALIDVDLSNDHPIGVVYNADAAHALNPTTTALGSETIADVLEGGQVHCASCHNVHNEAGEASLLRMSNAVSALCLACHDK